jgi:hypothetical protein
VKRKASKVPCATTDQAERLRAAARNYAAIADVGGDVDHHYEKTLMDAAIVYAARVLLEATT